MNSQILFAILWKNKKNKYIITHKQRLDKLISKMAPASSNQLSVRFALCYILTLFKYLEGIKTIEC